MPVEGGLRHTLYATLTVPDHLGREATLGESRPTFSVTRWVSARPAISLGFVDLPGSGARPLPWIGPTAGVCTVRVAVISLTAALVPPSRSVFDFLFVIGVR